MVEKCMRWNKPGICIKGKIGQKEKLKGGGQQREGYTWMTKETHIDTKTRTTGNKKGACVR